MFRELKTKIISGQFLECLSPFSVCPLLDWKQTDWWQQQHKNLPFIDIPKASHFLDYLRSNSFHTNLSGRSNFNERISKKLQGFHIFDAGYKSLSIFLRVGCSTWPCCAAAHNSIYTFPYFIQEQSLALIRENIQLQLENLRAAMQPERQVELIPGTGVVINRELLKRNEPLSCRRGVIGSTLWLLVKSPELIRALDRACILTDSLLPDQANGARFRCY